MKPMLAQPPYIDTIFMNACRTYLKAGGGRAFELINRAMRELQDSRVEDVRGHRESASEGSPGTGAPPSSPNRDGGGHPKSGTSARTTHAAPVREPSLAVKKAMASVAKIVALTVLDTYKIRDGRSIGDVRYGEIENLRSANAMEASIFRQIQRKVGFANHGTKLRELVSAMELNAMKQRAAEVADAQ